MPRQAKTTPIKKTNGRKRKSEVLDAEQETQQETTSDSDEDIVLIAKRVAAKAGKSQNQQQRLRENQQAAFSEEMKNINDGIPGMFDNHERNDLAQTKLLRLRELLLRRDELDQALTQHTLDLDKLISGAQRSLDTAVQTRKDELLDLRKMLESNIEAQTDGNPIDN